MEALALRALIGRDIISIHGSGLMTLSCLGQRSIHLDESALDGGAIRDGPLNTTFINGIIRAFRLAGAAIDTFIRYLDSHREKTSLFLKIYCGQRYNFAQR